MHVPIIVQNTVWLWLAVISASITIKKITRCIFSGKYVVVWYLHKRLTATPFLNVRSYLVQTTQVSSYELQGRKLAPQSFFASTVYK